MAKYPKNYMALQKKFPELLTAQEKAGKLAKKAGPLDEKTCQLIQLAACAALRSEGGVHSHARRAVKAGASKAEVYHAVALLINTIGFPTTAATFSWVNDIAGKKE
ncbi:MAG TPA: carboxymuconolactone decarboxylase family protein [Nitrospirae bacterium]|nr:carboxymuconolactone decarboxylase family protein [bacterium BMS3Abin10]GBE37989.1 carboxymuconolactone decarboxylase family protein [bacterium BMS3Bbin08]HDH51096.1 carboxymuconolactone decarboxylase family protein [Nitrospirota bacterium]HDK81529.1 carboxymuconolactone decarboxylase family protein [Nitrospirota bacterium]HDO26278.1 carboxymuconolactone decarboxylase family protein [Nitrospirota bacterium]